MASKTAETQAKLDQALKELTAAAKTAEDQKMPENCICCMEAPATIWCENCTMALCTENKCAVNLHLFPESMQAHKQKPINAAASAQATAQARDRLTQLLASLQASAAEDEKNKKKDGKDAPAAAPAK